MMASRREVGGDIQADQGASSPPVAWCLPIPASRAGLSRSRIPCLPHPPRPAPLTDRRRNRHRPQILTGRRTDLVADRTRTVNRLRAQLTGVFPGLERALDLTNTGPLVLTGYQTPAALRRTGKKRLET